MFRFATIARALAALAFLVGATLAHAQQAPLVGIEPIRATLDQIETQTRRSTLRVNALTELAQRISPLRDDLRDKLGDLEPRLADVDARLKGLGAAPAPPATEDPTIATERARLTRERNELDSAVKQVQLLQARATQLAATLTDRRRTAYAETMFRKSPNVLDPYFWRDVAMALPDYGERLAKFAQDWIDYARVQGGPARITSAAIALAGLLIFAIGFIRWWRRQAFIARIGDRYGMALASLAVFLRRALTAPIAVFLVLQLLDQFELIPDDYERLISGLIFGVADRGARTRGSDQRACARRSAPAAGEVRRYQRAVAVRAPGLGRAAVRRLHDPARRASHDRRSRRGRHRIAHAVRALDCGPAGSSAGARARCRGRAAAYPRHAAARLDRRRGHRGLTARRVCAIRLVCRGPRRVYALAGRDALSAADRHRRSD